MTNKTKSNTICVWYHYTQFHTILYCLKPLSFISTNKHK
jgi:hypothetical protein